MHVHAVKWYAGAILVFAMSAIILILAMNLMPPVAEAERKGIYIPWLITWGMIWTSMLIGIALGAFIVATGLNRVPSTDSPSRSRA